jgi:dihydroorotate dehydrogenase electron transfer subunit
MQKKIFNANTYVLQNFALNEKYFKLIVKVEKKVFENASPGHFAHVLCSKEILRCKNRTFADYNELGNYVRANYNRLKESHTLLRRPICIHDAYKKKDVNKKIYIFEFLIRIKRSGTTLLSKLKSGDSLEIIAPIGRPFNYTKSIKYKNDVIIVTGGMGIAPIAFLSRKLIENGTYPYIFFGFEEDFSLTAGGSMMNDLKKISKGFSIASNSIYEKDYQKGFVTDILEKHLMKMKSDRLKKTDIFACGPYPMLKKVSELADKFGLNCEISLEERMGCGIGACMACVCKTKKDDSFEYKRVCVDGPVFNSKEIIFANEN